MTVLAVALVAGVVAVASVLAGREDVRQATPDPSSTVQPTVSPPATNRIEFSTDSGSGVLEILDRGWDSNGINPGTPGSLLTVTIRLTSASGIISYGPDSFQAFDRQGTLIDSAYVEDSPTALELGTLSAGQQVSGTVAFDISRGGVTLLMNDGSSETVTALKVPD